jgi:3-mercaptopyruvate sulfurtransferase SseA
MRKMIALQTLFLALAVVLCGCATGASDEDAAGTTQRPSPAPASSQQSDPFASIPRVSVEELSKALEEGRAVVVDVRPAEAFEEEHIAGAFSIPEEEVRERAGELPRGKLVVAYCA